jgi:uncharacterized protein (DUF433 family)
MTAPTAVSTTVDLSKYIEMRDGRANIRGRRLPVSFIAGAALVNGLSNAEIAYEFTISESQVVAALLYYFEHRDEVDRQDAEEKAAFDEMYAKYGGRKPGQP